jgi:hypothetical protein
MLHFLGWDRMQKPYDHRGIMDNYYVPEDSWENVYPSIIPQWDRSPRTGSTYDVYTESTPELFRKSVVNAKKRILNKSPEHQILILRSWNEWAEGNYIEPDLRFGDGFIKALKSALTE